MSAQPSRVARTRHHRLAAPGNRRPGSSFPECQRAIMATLTRLSANWPHPASTDRRGSDLIEKLMEYGYRSWGDRFIRVEVGAYLQSRVGRIHSYDVGQKTEVIDIARPGRPCLHSEDMSPATPP